jgi:hypothetical protein
MASTQIAVNQHTALALGDADKRRERLFYSGMAIAMVLTCFAGFAPSYYLRPHVGTQPAMPGLLHLHGLVFSLWIALLVTQTSLVAANRTDLHRRLGAAGGVLALMMMVLGAIVAISRARQGTLGQVAGIPPLVFLAIPLTSVIVFPALIGAALYFRKRVDIHKRLILLATIEILSAAVGRLPGVVTASPFVLFAVADLFLLAIVAYDFVSRGRLHRATLWGGLFLMVSQFGRVLMAPTATWLALAHWMTGT